MTEHDEMFVKTANDIAADIIKNQDLVGDDSAQQFISRAEKEAEIFENIEREGRELTVGIIGCVKAGKSTLLNALVFDGNQVLPKAATPMTAALTRIRFSKEPKAHIFFYQTSDWINIKAKNDQYNRQVEMEFQRRCNECQSQANSQGNSKREQKGGMLRSIKNTIADKVVLPTRKEVEADMCACGEIPDEVRSSHELVKMAEECRLDVDKYLGKEQIIDFQSGADYFSALTEYVGSEGQFTPIVNYTELYIDDSRLEGMEIVDTPGLNDPIVSRERKTVKFLEQCDVVFVASSVSQFLVESDIQLIRKKLNQNNIHRAYIVGTQLDSGVLQYKSRCKSLEEALSGSIIAYKKQAKDVISRINNTPNAPSIIRRLDESEPVFVSAMMYGIGKKMVADQPLSPEEDYIITNFKSRFMDFETVMENFEDYFVFSHIDTVKDDIFMRVSEEKEATIRERIEKLTVNQSAELLRLLEIVNTSVRMRLSSLESADAEVLERKLSQLSNKLDSIRSEISGIFQRQAEECNRIIQDTKIEISKEIGHHQDIEIEIRTEHHHETKHTGLFGLRNTLVEWDEHIKEVSSSQVINNVQQYAATAQRIINENFRKLFDIEGMKGRIKNCVIGAFDLANKDFDENEILLPLEVVLAGLTVQEVRFDFLEQLEESVDAEFPDGKAEGEAIHRLYALQSKLVNKVLQQLADLMQQQNERISNTMNVQSGTFVDTIEGKIAGNIEELKKQLKNKQENIVRYKRFIEKINTYKQRLKQFQR